MKPSRGRGLRPRRRRRRLGAGRPARRRARGRPWIAAAGRATCSANRGRGVVVAGEQQPAGRARARPRHQRAPRQRRPDRATRPRPWRRGPVDQIASLRELVADMDARARSSLLVILGGNPVVHRAGRPGVRAGAWTRSPLRVHLGLYDDETVGAATGTCPQAHYLESWGDARAYDGTRHHHPAADRAALRRQVGPRAAGGLLARPADRTATTSSAPTGAPTAPWAARLRARPGGRRSTTASSPARALPADGRGARAGGTRRAPRRGRARGRRAGDRLPPRPDDLRRPLRQQRLAAGAAQAAHQADLGQRGPHEPGDGDGASASPSRHRARQPTDVVELRYRGRSVQRAGLDRARPRRRRGHGPPRLRPARGPGRVGTGAGFNAYALRTSATRRGSGAGLEVGEDRRARTPLACTQDHWSMEGRDLVRARHARRSTAQHPRLRARRRVHEPARRR